MFLGGYNFISVRFCVKFADPTRNYVNFYPSKSIKIRPLTKPLISMADYDPLLRCNPEKYELPGSDDYGQNRSISTRNKAVISYGDYEFSRYFSMQMSQFLHRKTMPGGI